MTEKDRIIRLCIDSYKKGTASGITICCDAIADVLAKGLPDMMMMVKESLLKETDHPSEEVEEQIKKMSDD